MTLLELENKLVKDIKEALIQGIGIENVYMLLKKLSFLYTHLYNDEIHQYLKKAHNEKTSFSTEKHS